uniref:Uncharacterized protein n=1 Tax=Timema bartmani TaxID=61472 RepID=A0A7R9I253_9NEOP|nr:unnamed protein product [Timema bartmani]
MRIWSIPVEGSGCGLTFMFIITMLVLTIGRTHLKRFLISPPALRSGTHISPQRVNRSTRHHHGLQDVPLYELDCFPNHSLNNCSPSLLSVSYNVPNDINFVGRPVDPPPYCEVLSSPPKEGPPPPYASQDNLSIDIREREADSESSSGEADSLLDSTQTSVFGEHVSYVLSNTTLPITAAAAAESSEISEFSTTLEKLVDKLSVDWIIFIITFILVFFFPDFQIILKLVVQVFKVVVQHCTHYYYFGNSLKKF